jgi:hypothetical protein
VNRSKSGTSATQCHSEAETQASRVSDNASTARPLVISAYAALLQKKDSIAAEKTTDHRCRRGLDSPISVIAPLLFFRL